MLYIKQKVHQYYHHVDSSESHVRWMQIIHQRKMLSVTKPDEMKGSPRPTNPRVDQREKEKK